MSHAFINIHVVYLAFLKIKLMHDCMSFYYYMQMNVICSLSTCLNVEVVHSSGLYT